MSMQEHLSRARALRRACFLMPPLAWLAGCATQRKAAPAAFEQAPPPGPGQTLIYVYRMESTTMAGTDAEIYLNGARAASVAEKTYTWFHAPAGRNELEHRWANRYQGGQPSMVTIWEPGSRHVFRVDAMVSNAKTHTRLAEVPLADGLVEIAQCVLRPHELRQAVPVRP